MEIVKKLSVGKLVGNVKAVLPDNVKDTSSITLARLVGIARGSKTGESQFGMWTSLTGDFVFEPLMGANAGKRFRSGQLFMPDVALDLVLPLVDGLGKGEGVEVAFALTVRRDETSQIGYSYGAQFLMEPQENDPIMGLLDKAMPALPSPEGDTETGETADAPEAPAKGSKAKR